MKKIQIVNNKFQLDSNKQNHNDQNVRFNHSPVFSKHNSTVYSLRSKVCSLKSKVYSLMSIVFLLLMITGCQSTSGNTGNVHHSYSQGSVEAQWIRNGNPISFEDDLWYPADGVESFKSSEMLLMGDQHGTQFFVDKVDVRPFNRLYTRFDKNKFRFFEKR